MPEIANWNGHSFVVSSNLIRGFTNLTIEGSCETTEKNSEDQKYTERKSGESGKISMTVELNALTGVTDVYKEAMEYYAEANAGASAYFYLGGTKLVPAKLRLISAQISEIVYMPGRGDVWIQCQVALSFEQGGQNDGAAASNKSPNSGTKKLTSSGSTQRERAEAAKKNPMPVSSGYAKLKAQAAAETAGKAASKDAKSGGAGLAAQEKAIERATTTTRDTGVKKSPTTGRAPAGGAGKKSSIVQVTIK